jgi:hypothetical protein
VKEQIVKDAQANAMLRRKYREPFVVPEINGSAKV